MRFKLPVGVIFGIASRKIHVQYHIQMPIAVVYLELLKHLLK